jgi:rod shape-determining protein MreB
MAHPVSLACAPTDTSEKERNYLSGAILHAGASHVSIIPEVWAAAIGAGMDVSQPSAQVLIDMGDGVTDMAVIREGRIIYASAVRIACGDLQKAIRSAIMTKYRIRLFAHEAERLTHEIASMSNQQESSHGFINAGGVDMNKRCEVTIKIDSNDVISAMAPVVNKIIKMIETGLQKLPENIYCEIIESGICLTGGGACIKGIDRLIALRTRMDVRIANDPMHSVINGAIQTLDYWKGEKCWWKNIVWPDLVT